MLNANVVLRALFSAADDEDLDEDWIVEQVMELYPPTNFSNDPLRALWQADADAGVVCPMLDLATMLSLAGAEVCIAAINGGIATIKGGIAANKWGIATIKGGITTILTPHSYGERRWKR